MRQILSHLGLLAVCGLLAACGLNIPDPAPYMARCEAFERQAPSGPISGLFFMTSRLPDCRGNQLLFAGFRDPRVRFGISDLPLEGSEPWKRHASILLDDADWQATLQRELHADNNAGRLLVYVHGYYNNFEDALRTASNLRELYYRGVPTVVVSWPSRNDRLAYTEDEDSIGWAQDYLDELLLQLSVTSDDITIVSHSMGARAVLRAVERLDLEGAGTGRHVRRIVLASPDVDRDQVLRPNGVISRLMRQEGRKILVYASQRDIANRASQWVHGYSRLGSSDCSFDVVFARRSLAAEGDCHLTTSNERLAIVDTSDAPGHDLARHHDFVETCAGRVDLSAFFRDKDITWRERIERSERPGQSLVGYRIAPALITNQQMAEFCPPTEG